MRTDLVRGLTPFIVITRDVQVRGTCVCQQPSVNALLVHLRTIQLWFRQWFETIQTRNHYQNLWWPSHLTHKCVTSPQCVKHWNRCHATSILLYVYILFVNCSNGNDLAHIIHAFQHVKCLIYPPIYVTRMNAMSAQQRACPLVCGAMANYGYWRESRVNSYSI